MRRQTCADAYLLPTIHRALRHEDRQHRVAVNPRRVEHEGSGRIREVFVRTDARCSAGGIVRSKVDDHHVWHEPRVIPVSSVIAASQRLSPIRRHLLPGVAAVPWNHKQAISEKKVQS